MNLIKLMNRLCNEIDKESNTIDDYSRTTVKAIILEVFTEELNKDSEHIKMRIDQLTAAFNSLEKSRAA